MNVRVVAAVVVALLVGAGGGWAVAASADDDRVAEPRPQTATVAPVSASPSVPVALVSPDPDHPALHTELPLVTVELSRPDEVGVPGASKERSSLPVPRGWTRVAGDDKYTFTDPDAPEDTYLLAVEFLEDTDVPTALRRRTAAIESAEIEGNLADVDLEITPIADGFDSSFIDAGGFRRVQLERFYPGPGGRIVTVRANGRERDRAGLANLVNLISTEYRVVG